MNLPETVPDGGKPVDGVNGTFLGLFVGFVDDATPAGADELVGLGFADGISPSAPGGVNFPLDDPAPISNNNIYGK
jgi:hypothetical protein